MDPSIAVFCTMAQNEACEIKLKEVLSQEAGKSAVIEMKVLSSDLAVYEYSTRDGKKKEGRKLTIILITKDASQYCIGVAKMTPRGGVKDMEEVQKKWAVGTCWKLSKIVPDKTEKQAYINTSVKIAIELRKTDSKMMLQSPDFPSVPAPNVSVANILTLREHQRFDLIALVTTKIGERRANGSIICDCRLVDGSETETGKYASLPITLWFSDQDDMNTFDAHVKKTPLLFMGLQGRFEDDTVVVSTVKNLFSWAVAKGDKAQRLESEAQKLCDDEANLTDVAALRANPISTIDFLAGSATLVTAKHLATGLALHALLGEEQDRLVQLNNVYITAPEIHDEILTIDKSRLFAKLAIWDQSGKAEIYFRGKAMCHLASLTDSEVAEYKAKHSEGELHHLILASIRVQLKKQQKEGNESQELDDQGKWNHPNAVVVEAQACDLESIPNAALRSVMHDTPDAEDTNTERLISAALAHMSPSPFYNMCGHGKGADKALALLHFSEKTTGKQLQGGFRLMSERVTDFTDDSKAEPTQKTCYAVIAICSVEKATDFRALPNDVHLVVISKMDEPAKPEKHRADLYIEAMERILPEKLESAKQMMLQMQQMTRVRNAASSTEDDVEVNNTKCARLCRYPTLGA